MSANCKTCKHNDGRMVVSKGEEPCYSCLASGKEFPKYEADIQRITNADRIRAMSDEELAKYVCCPHDQCIDLDAPCDKCVLSWLKSPMEVDDGT